MPFSGSSLLSHRNPLSYVFSEGTRANEKIPNGVPTSYTWRLCAQVLAGTTPTVSVSPNGYPVECGDSGLVAGQTLNPDICLRAENLGLMAYKQSLGAWVSIHSMARPVGDQRNEDYTSPIAFVTHSNPPNPLIVEYAAGKLIHLFTSGTRPTVDTTDCKAWLSYCTLKLISKTGADVRPSVGKYYGRVSMDWWPSASAPTGNEESYGGSNKLVREYGQIFYSTSMRLNEFALYGVPNLPQLTDTSYTPGPDPYYVP